MDERSLLTLFYWEGVGAVDPRSLVRDYLESHPLEHQGIYLLSVGKGGTAMALGAWEALGKRVKEGLVVIPRGWKRANLPWRVIEGEHPLPGLGSLEGGKTALELAEKAEEGDTFLLLLSGGASSLMEVPRPGLTLKDLVDVNRRLILSGATIQETNAVRKHLSAIKGGHLALKAWPARVKALVLSDVVGDPLDVIGSGPAHPDPTTFAMALETLRRRGILSHVPSKVVTYLQKGQKGEVPETPKGDVPLWSRVDHHILGSNRKALETMARTAQEKRIKPIIYTSLLHGEAREVAKVMAALAWEEALHKEEPKLLLWGGEPTVTVKGKGKGGRAQEMALALALELAERPGSFLVAGTDGIDGNTRAAGAFGDGGTVSRAREKGLDPLAFLNNNDSYPFFGALEDLFTPGPTGTNVMDVALFLLP